MWEGADHCGQWYPWAGGSGLTKKTRWANQGESGQHSLPLLLQSLPLGSCPGFPQWSTVVGCISQKSPFLPTGALSVFYDSNRKQTRTGSLLFSKGINVYFTNHCLTHLSYYQRDRMPARFVKEKKDALDVAQWCHLLSMCEDLSSIPEKAE